MTQSTKPTQPERAWPCELRSALAMILSRHYPAQYNNSYLIPYVGWPNSEGGAGSRYFLYLPTSVVLIYMALTIARYVSLPHVSDAIILVLKLEPGASSSAMLPRLVFLHQPCWNICKMRQQILLSWTNLTTSRERYGINCLNDLFAFGGWAPLILPPIFTFTTLKPPIEN